MKRRYGQKSGLWATVAAATTILLVLAGVSSPQLAFADGSPVNSQQVNDEAPTSLALLTAYNDYLGIHEAPGKAALFVGSFSGDWSKAPAATVELHEVGQASPVQSTSLHDSLPMVPASGVYFYVDIPASGYNQYYVTYGSIKSNITTVSPQNTTSWQVQTSPTATAFAGANPMLYYYDLNGKLTDSGDGFYVIDRASGHVVYKTDEDPQDDYGNPEPITVQLPNLPQNQSREYQAVVAPWDASATQLSDLQVVYKTGSTIVGYEAWNALVGLDDTGSTPVLNITGLWRSVTDSGYALYVVDKSTDTVLDQEDTIDGISFSYPLSDIPQGSSHDYQVYIAKSEASTPLTPEDLSDVQFATSPVSVQNDPISVSLSSDQGTYVSYRTDSGAPTLSWSTNQPLSAALGDKAVYIFSYTTGKIVYRKHGNVSSGTYTPPVSNPIGDVYLALVADWDASATAYSQLSGLSDASSGVSEMVQSYRVNLDVTQATSTAAGKLTVRTSQPVEFTHGNNPAAQMYLTDSTTGQVLAHSSTMGTSYVYSLNSAQEASGDTYSAFLLPYGQASNVTTETEIWKSIRLGTLLGLDSVSYGTDTSWKNDSGSTTDTGSDSATVQLSTTADKVSGSFYQYASDSDTPLLKWKTSNLGATDGEGVYVVDDASGHIISASEASTGTVTAPRDWNDVSPVGYHAYLAPWDASAANLSDLTVDMKSNPIQLQHKPWDVNVSPVAQADSSSSPQIRVSLNQPLTDAAFPNTYQLYLVDKTQGQIIDRVSSMSADKVLDVTTLSANQQDDFVAVIAPKLSASATAGDLQPIASSGKLPVQGLGFTASLKLTQEDADGSTPGDYKLTYGSDYNSPDANYYAVYLVNADTGAIVASKSLDDNADSVSSIYRTPLLYAPATAQHYQAWVALSDANATTLTDLNLSQDQSDPVTLQPLKTVVTLTPGSNDPNPGVVYKLPSVPTYASPYASTNGVPFQLTWSVSGCTGNCNLYIVDEGAQAVVRTIAVNSATTSGTVSFGIGNLGYEARDLQFQAYLLPSSASVSFPRPATGWAQTIADSAPLTYKNSSGWDMMLNSTPVYKDLTASSSYPGGPKVCRFYWSGLTYEQNPQYTHDRAVYMVNDATGEVEFYSHDIMNEDVGGSAGTNGDVISNPAAPNQPRLLGPGGWETHCDPNAVYRFYIAATPYNASSGMYNFYTNRSQFTHIYGTSTVFNLDDETAAGGSGPKNPGESTGASNPSEHCNAKCVVDPVNTSNGELFEDSTDLSLKSLLPLALQRSYSSTEAAKLGSFGYGWVGNFDAHVTGSNAVNLSQSSTVTVYQENDSTVQFTRNSDGTYKAPARVFADLAYDSVANTFALTRNNGVSFVFSAGTGNLLKIKDRNKNALTLSYGEDGHLAQVSSSNHQWLKFTWANDVIISVKASNGQTVNYDYSDDQQLLAVHLPGVANAMHYGYGATNLLTSYANTDGGVTTTAYDSANRVSRQVDPMAEGTSFSYQTLSSGNVQTTMTPDHGTSTVYVYSPSYQLLSETRAAGTVQSAVTSYAYGITNQPITITDPLGHATYYTYDPNGNVSSVTDSLKHTTAYTYNGFNEITSTTNPASKISHNYYDTRGNLKETVSFSGKASHYTYNNDGTLSSEQNPNEEGTALTTQYTYDQNEYASSVINADSHSTSTQNDASGNVLSATNAQQKTTTYTYDLANRLTGLSYPNGSATATTYGLDGRLATSTDRSGHVTSYTYLLDGKVHTIATPLGTTTYAYYPQGWLKSKIDYANRETDYTYDLLGNLAQTKDPENHISYATYNLDGTLATATDGNGNTTTYGYDSTGNLTSTKNAKNDVAKNTYNELGQLAEAKDYRGLVSDYTYTTDGQLSQETRSDDSSVRYYYDDNGNLLRRVDSSAGTESYAYDHEDRLASYKNLKGQATSYEYDSLGQLSSKTFGGHTVYYSYSSMGQVSAVSYASSGSTPSDVSYSHNPDGTLHSTQKAGITTDYDYDTLGNLSYVGAPGMVNAPGVGVHYTYNGANELASILYPDALKVTYSYDNDGNVTQVNAQDTLGVDLPIQSIAGYTYDANGNETSVALGNGVTQTQSFDALNQETGVSISHSSSNLYSEAYGYDKDGQLASKTTSVPVASSQSYIYNKLNQLETITGDGSNAYSYTGTNDVLTTNDQNSVYDKLGTINSMTTSDDVIAYSYDSRGNRAGSVKTPEDPAASVSSTTYNWNADNTLASIATAAGSSSYSYNASGLITSSVQVSGNTSSSETYVWDLNASLPLMLEDGETSYVYGANATPVAQINKGTYAIRYLSADYQGSVVAVTDANASLSAAYRYSPYGQLLTAYGDASHSVTHFGYAGQYLDSATGLYYMRARWYDPASASFISLDPASLLTNQAYSYASGDPVNHFDPLGLWTNTLTDDQKTLARIGLTVLGSLAVVAAFGIAAACDIATDGLCVVADGAIVDLGFAALSAATLAAGQYAVTEDCPTLSGLGIHAAEGGAIGLAGGSVGRSVAGLAEETTALNLAKTTPAAMGELGSVGTEQSFDKWKESLVDQPITETGCFEGV